MESTLSQKEFVWSFDHKVGEGTNNYFPLDIRQSNSVSVFKKNLKTSF